MIRVHAEADLESRQIYVTFNGGGDEFKDYVARIKTFLTRRFDPSLKCWVVPLSMEAVRELNRNFPGLEQGVELVNFVDSNTQKTDLALDIEKLKLQKDVEIPGWDWGPTKPFPHQKVSFDVFTKLPYSFNMSSMGVGKTYVACQLIKYRREREGIHNCLIVAPLSVLGVWQSELQRHGMASKKEIVVLEGSLKNRAEMLGKRDFFYIVNYESLWRLVKAYEIEKEPFPVFDMVIADEAHKIKNPSAKQTKGLIKVGKMARFRHALTGTPVSQSPLDVWAPCLFLEGTEPFGFENYYTFQNKYSIVTRTKLVGQMKIPIRRAWTNLPDLERKMSGYSLRYTKEQCLSLPPKTYTTRETVMGGDQLDAYQKLQEEMRVILSTGKEVSTPNLLSFLTRARQITSGHVGTTDKDIHFFGKQSKLELLEDVLNELEDKDKIVVWCQFLPTIAMLSNYFQSKGVTYVSLSGGTKQKDRDGVIKQFQEGGTKIFIGQEDTGGLGISLTASNICIYYDQGYKWASRSQSEDRLHRQGQTSNKVTYIDLLCTLGLGPRGGIKKSIDHRIKEIIAQKKDIASKITGDDVLNWISEEENK